MKGMPMTLDNASPYDPENPFNLSYPSFKSIEGPTLLELTKALRDCLKTAQGGISVAPLNELIGKYEWDLNNFLQDDKEENKKFGIDVFSLPDEDYHPYEKTGFGD